MDDLNLRAQPVDLLRALATLIEPGAPPKAIGAGTRRTRTAKLQELKKRAGRPLTPNNRGCRMRTRFTITPVPDDTSADANRRESCQESP